MGKKILLGLILSLLTMVSLGWCQGGKAPSNGPVNSAVLQQWAMTPAQFGRSAPNGYQPPVQAQTPIQTQIPSPGQPVEGAGWPTYPYPQYHNPYYQSSDPRTVFNETVDWVFRLPSNVMDRFANFLDKNFFPPSPATHGNEASPQGSVGSAEVRTLSPSGSPVSNGR